MSAGTSGRQWWRRRPLVLALAGALAVSLLPLVVLAQPQQVENPEDACPEDTNPPAPFVDRLDIPQVHRLNVDCAYNTGITEGFSDQTYRPALIVRRDQFASFIVRTMQSANVDLPPPTDQGFTDIQGNVHEDNINILAQTGITSGTTPTTFSPAQSLFRDQIASMVMRAASYIEDVPLENIQRDDGPFTDVPEDNVHRRNINGARGLNLTVGRTATTYEPRSGTRRDQMASFLVRLLATLTGDEPIIPGEDRAETIDLAPETATNPVGTVHSLAATVRDEDEALVAEANVRFEIYRDSDGDGAFDGPVTQGTQRTDAEGVSEFTYTGPEVEAEDVIVACAVRPAETCEVTDTDEATAGTQFTGQPDAAARVFDVAAKTWSEDLPPPIDTIDVDEEDLDATNFLGDTHTITVTGTEEGAPVSGAEVRFEVYRAPAEDGTFSGPVESATVTTDGDGRASFSYDGPAEPAVDRIVICAPADDSCGVTDTDAGTEGTQFTGQPAVGAEPNAVATKRWVHRPDVIDIDDDDLDATNPLGQPHALSATVLDPNGEPLQGAAIRFEVYRAPDEDGTFSGPVTASTETTDGDGRVTFTYDGPDAPAVDRIVVCAPVDDSCDVTDTDTGTEGIQFTGEPVVGAEPNAVATKRWVVPVAADSVAATAYGVNAEVLGVELLTRLPEVSIALPPGDTAEETDEILEVPLAPVIEAGVVEVAARGDRPQGRAQAEAQTADVIVLGEGDIEDIPELPDDTSLLDDLLGDGGEPLVTADAVRAVSTSTCPEPGNLAQASAGSQFVNLRVAGVEVPLNPQPNTTIEVPGVAEVVIREVIPEVTAEGHGYTVRGLRITLLDGTAGEIIVSEAHSSVVCSGAGSTALGALVLPPLAVLPAVSGPHGPRRLRRRPS